MPAHEHVSDLQFHYDNPYEGGSTKRHRILAKRGGEDVGQMIWTHRSIEEIGAMPRRQGIATAMWQEGHRLAAENARIPKPKHSAQRTTEGDAWARSVGGPLPRRDRR